MTLLHVITDTVGALVLTGLGIFLVMWLIQGLRAAISEVPKLREEVKAYKQACKRLENHCDQLESSLRNKRSEVVLEMERLKRDLEALEEARAATERLRAKPSEVDVDIDPYSDPNRPMWEYVSAPAGDRQQIDKLASEGWELQLASEGSGKADEPRAPTLFFKRRMNVAT